MSAAKATTDINNYVPSLTPISSTATMSKSTSLSSTEIQEVTNLSFPRCSCCKTGWYDALGLVDDNDLADAQKLAVSAGKRKRHRDRPSHNNLLPMPTCECITRLAVPSLPSDINRNCNPQDVLAQIKTHSFPNLAICKLCLKHRIAASKEITVHDYHQGHIPNGQRDVRFTVELCCVQCKRKFSVRFLEKLLDSEGTSNSTTNAVKNRKQIGKQDANWPDAVEATIKLVGWAKRDIRKERRRIRQRRKNANLKRIDLAGTSERDVCRWNNLNVFTGGDDNCSSDDCYSFSSDSSDDSDELSHPTKGPHRQELQPGELMSELLKKDPKFRQEKEDEKYVKKVLEEQELHAVKADVLDAQAIEDEVFVKKLIEQENEAKRKAEEERVREDHEFAMKMQRKLNKQTSTTEPVKTRSKSPILNAWNKSSTAAGGVSDRKKSRTPVSANRIAPRKKDTYHEHTDEVSIISTTPAEASLGASSRTSFRTPQSVNSVDRNRAQSKQSDERATSQVSDKLVDEIVAMGFSKSSAQRSLRLAAGDVQRAMDLLLSESADPT